MLGNDGGLVSVLLVSRVIAEDSITFSSGVIAFGCSMELRNAAASRLFRLSLAFASRSAIFCCRTSSSLSLTAWTSSVSDLRSLSASCCFFLSASSCEKLKNDAPYCRLSSVGSKWIPAISLTGSSVRHDLY